MTLSGLRITAVPATHDSRRAPFGPEAEPIGYLVSGSRSVYFAGDTDLFEAMSELRGLVDVALLPVAGWGRSLGPGHLDPERAAQAAGLIGPERRDSNPLGHADARVAGAAAGGSRSGPLVNSRR